MKNPKLILIEDKGQKEGEHEIKNKWWKENEIEVRRYPVPVGDYIIANKKVADVVNRKFKRGISVKKMDFLGTFNVSVDTKKDIQEIISNLCGGQHERVRDDYILAQNNGIKLYVLIENEDGITCIDDLDSWINPRQERYEKIKEMHSEGRWKSIKLPKSHPTKGETLAKAMRTMEKKYGVTFKFCTPEEAGKEVIRLLMKGENDERNSIN